MSRRNRSYSRKILPDTKFKNKLVAKFINHVMMHGKKSVAMKIVYTAFSTMAQTKVSNNIIELFHKSLENTMPVVEVKSRRVGGATYQVPVEVRSDRQQTLAIRWIINAAFKRKEKSMGIRIGHELLDALNCRGAAVKKREDTHRMAEANKAFAHFRW